MEPGGPRHDLLGVARLKAAPSRPADGAAGVSAGDGSERWRTSDGAASTSHVHRRSSHVDDPTVADVVPAAYGSRECSDTMRCASLSAVAGSTPSADTVTCTLSSLPASFVSGV
jgi:hypothetical protein